TIPPSPRLLARKISTAYLSDTITIRDQMTRETTPSTADDTGVPPPDAALTASLSAYNGLGPMSPYTTPSAPSVAAVGSRSRRLTGWGTELVVATVCSARILASSLRARSNRQER